MTKKILVIDDEPEVIKILQIRLERDKFQVITANNGKTALQKIKLEIPDLIILDIMMPGMDGYQVCEKIKSDPSTGDIPIIMLTAKNMGEDLEMALEKKADWYVIKPYEYKYLLKKINQLIQRSEKTQISNKKFLVIDDEVEILETLTVYFKKFNSHILKAENGKEGLRIAIQEKPDLIILDVMLPEVDGYRVCKELKENPKTKNIPVIMLTALAQETDERAGFESGADAYASKPFDFPRLLEEIKRLLRRENK